MRNDDWPGDRSTVRSTDLFKTIFLIQYYLSCTCTFLSLYDDTSYSVSLYKFCTNLFGVNRSFMLHSTTYQVLETACSARDICHWQWSWADSFRMTQPEIAWTCTYVNVPVCSLSVFNPFVEVGFSGYIPNHVALKLRFFYSERQLWVIIWPPLLRI